MRWGTCARRRQIRWSSSRTGGVRPFVRKLIELEFPHLWVVSRREAIDADTMPVIATIELD